MCPTDSKEEVEEVPIDKEVAEVLEATKEEEVKEESEEEALEKDEHLFEEGVDSVDDIEEGQDSNYGI